MNVKQIFGQNLKRIRQDRGYSQEVLADRAGLHRTYVGSVERGERNISLVNIATLARALDVSISELFTGIITQKHEDAS
jgi:transcriptional regulator with XRE-family HTH domain